MPNQITITCPSCAQEYRVSATTAGHRARCTKCQTSFVIPQQSTCDEDTILAWIAQGNADADSATTPSRSAQASAGRKTSQGGSKRDDGPRVELLRIDEEGAHFEFPASSLPNEDLRDSFPRKCVGCHTTDHLRVHLLCWPDRMTPAEAARWEELQNTPVGSWAQLWKSATSGWMERLTLPWQAPSPFDQPFPFLVCRECRPAYEVQGTIVARDTSEMCIVTIRNLGIAVEFCESNGGRHTSDYHRLLEARDVGAMAGKEKS